MRSRVVRLTTRSALAICCLSPSLNASEEITCRSPDGKFALRCVSADAQPYNGETEIVEIATHKNVVSLNPNWVLGEVKLVWSPDSQRVAYFEEKTNGYVTRVFSRSGSSFNEIALPKLPSPKLPVNATGSEADTNTRVEPMKWIGDLLLEKESINPAWGRAALRITLGFDQNNSPTIRNAEQEKIPIIDYFLLLPPENFEAPLSAWLRRMRTGGAFYLCDADHPKDLVDERNGYMRCSGDGAQPEFEVVLFRHRDPARAGLLAVCSGALEGEDSVALKFFEKGADGKMHEIKRSIFPIADSKDDRWHFQLPREGRTVVVRAQKDGKILHKITWNGDKFVEQK
jgi:hypothetical protein